MKVKNLTFITPLIDTKEYKLDTKYSQTMILPNGDEINFASNQGPKPHQEDSVAISTNNNYILLLVADGLGGRIEGSEASYITASTIQSWFNSLTIDELNDINEKTLTISIRKLINEMKDENFPLKGGTTLNMSIISPTHTFIINIGDSRTYGIKDNEVTYVTKDDSYGFKIYNPSTKEERDALRFYNKLNVITNCIEMKSIATIHVQTIKNDDYETICHMTDGISDILKEDEIKEYCIQTKPAELLVEKAIESELIYNQSNYDEAYRDFIYPHDNATAIVYTKKRKKNN